MTRFSEADAREYMDTAMLMMEVARTRTDLQSAVTALAFAVLAAKSALRHLGVQPDYIEFAAVMDFTERGTRDTPYSMSPKRLISTFIAGPTSKLIQTEIERVDVPAHITDY